MPEYTPRDAEVHIKELRKRLDQLTSGNWDRHGLRLINCGRSLDFSDYVIKGEVNELVEAALENIDVFQTVVNNVNSGGSGGLQNPLIESILASMDSTYDIGASGTGNRIRNTYTDIINAETVEFTNTTHTNQWKMQQNSGNLEITDLGNVSSINFQSLVTRFDKDITALNNTIDIGTIATGFNDIWVESGYKIAGSHGSLDVGTFGLDSNGSFIHIKSDPLITTPLNLVEIETDANEDGIIRVRSNLDQDVIILEVGTDDSALISLKNDNDRTVLQLFAAGFDQVDTGYALFYNNDATPEGKVFIGVKGAAGGGVGALRLTDDATSVTSTGAELTARNVTVANQMQLNTDFVPSADKTHDLGIDSRRWAGIFGETLDLEDSSNNNDTITIKNTSGARRVAIGMRDTLGGSGIACETSTVGEDVSLVATTTDANRGLYVDSTKVVGAQGATISDPTGGATVDSEARTAINALIDRLQAHGLIA